MVRIKRYSKGEVYERDVFIEKKYNDVYSEFYLLKSVMKKNFEKSVKKKIKSSDNDFEVKRVSLSRTKKNIRDLALCNDFDFFYTQTFKPSFNRYDLDFCVDLIKKRFKAYKRKNPSFCYLVLYEHHKDGAVHLHGLLKSVEDEELIKNVNGYLTFKFLLPLGFNSLSKIKDNLKCSNYITKYISKSFCKTSHNQIYFCSKGLKRPSMNRVNFNQNEFLEVFSNDFVKKYVRRKKNGN